MTAADELRRRLGFVVVGIDAGTWIKPENAVDALLGTLTSHTVEHRAQLIAWLIEAGVLIHEAWLDPRITRNGKGTTSFSTLTFVEERTPEDGCRALYAVAPVGGTS